MIGVALLFLVNGVVVGSYLPRLPEIRDRLEIDLGSLGLTLALGGLGSLVGSAVSGLIVGRYGSRRSAVTAAAVVYLFLPLVAVMPTAPLLAVVLGAMGFVDAQADVGMNAVGARVEAEVGRSVMNRFHGLWSLGTLIGSGISALSILLGVGLVAHLLFVSTLGAVTALVAARLIGEYPVRARQADRSGRLALGLMVAGGFAVFVEGAPFDWGALFLTDHLGTTRAVGGTGVICFTAGMLAGRLVGDRVVDRFGAIRVLYAGTGLSLLALWFVVSVPVPAAALPGLVVWGVGISVALPVLYKLAASHPSFGEGSGLAALTVGTRLGFMAAPAVIGFAATTWNLPTALAVVVGTAGLAAILATRLTIGMPVSGEDSVPGTGLS